MGASKSYVIARKKRGHACGSRGRKDRRVMGFDGGEKCRTGGFSHASREARNFFLMGKLIASIFVIVTWLSKKELLLLLLLLLSLPSLLLLSLLLLLLS